MNPSFYPKHLARQYAQAGSLGNADVPLRQQTQRPWAQVYPLHGGANSQQNSISNYTNRGDQVQQVVDEQVQKEQTMQNISGIGHQIPSVASSSVRTNKRDVISSTSGKLLVPSNSAVFSGLPQTFIEAMKKLFDMVDVHGEGKVRLEGKYRHTYTSNTLK